MKRGTVAESPEPALSGAAREVIMGKRAPRFFITAAWLLANGYEQRAPNWFVRGDVELIPRGFSEGWERWVAGRHTAPVDYVHELDCG